MHHDMKTLIDWFRVNKLSLNIGKTVLMQFWPADEKQTMEFKLEGLIFLEVSHTKSLGVHLDKKLNSEYHINQLYNKIKANQQLLNLSKNLILEEHLVKIYYAHIYSHIQCGIIAWGSMAKKSMTDIIYTAQKACIR